MSWARIMAPLSGDPFYLLHNTHCPNFKNFNERNLCSPVVLLMVIGPANVIACQGGGGPQSLHQGPGSK